MKSDSIIRNSLKTRITLITLAVFVVSIWSLMFYFSRVIQKDLQHELGEQQFSTVSIMASEINHEVDLRFGSLKKIAEQITPAMLNSTAELQRLLEDRPILDILFNGGYYVVQADGIAVADVPLSTGRIGTDFNERDWMIDALNGKATIGKPLIGKKLQVPLFIMASPIRDSGGKVIGVLAGVTDLGKPNFLDRVVDNKYGKTGGFLLAAPQHNLLVTATDRTRILQPLPAPGVNPQFDRYKQGFEGFGRAVNSLGVEELTASKRIPAAGWLLIVKTPTSEAFAPFNDTQQHFIYATTIMTLLVGCVIWWLLKQQLSPIFTAVNTLTRMSEGSQPAELLPVVRQDELGLLINGFNTLLKSKEKQEESLKLSEERFRKAIEEAPFPIMIHAEDGEVLTLSRAWTELSGYTLEDIPTTTIWAEKAYGTHKEPVIEEIKTLYNLEHRKTEGEYTVNCHDGSKRIWDFSSVSITFLSDGRRTAMSMASDVTDRIIADEQLRNSEELYRNLFNNSEIAIFRSRLDGSELFDVNQKFLDMLEMTREETIGKPSSVLWAEPKERENLVQLLLTDGRVSGFEYKMLTKFGEIRNCITSLVLYPEHEIIEGSILDITKLKQAEHKKHELEQQLQHTQKLESLGVLAGGIAHDFNNILAIIIGYCSLTKLNYGKAEKNIPIIEDAAERAAGLCRQMLAYAGKAQLTKSKISMVNEVEEILGMLKASLPQNAVIKTNLSPEIPIIEGDASQLRQVAMNLIINASEAIGTEQGVIDVSLTRIKVKAGKAYEDYHGKSIPPGEYVCLEVTDNGCGMDDTTKRRIFEPFYTTKFTGRGLGMSAVLGIINSHNGALQLFSQLGKGTTFKVYLPAPTSGAAENGGGTTSAPVAAWLGSGTILLAEDEDHVRDIAKNFLEMFGFTVLEAVNGKEALDIYQKNAAKITLVLTDMGMPVMDGFELFHKLKSLDPELPIIVSSGYGDVEVCARIGSDNIAGIISKPYNPNQLQDVLKSVMDNN